MLYLYLKGDLLSILTLFFFDKTIRYLKSEFWNFFNINKDHYFQNLEYFGLLDERHVEIQTSVSLLRILRVSTLNYLEKHIYDNLGVSKLKFELGVLSYITFYRY